MIKVQMIVEDSAANVKYDVPGGTKLADIAIALVEMQNITDILFDFYNRAVLGDCDHDDDEEEL